MRGWSTNIHSDNYLLRLRSLEFCDLDVIGIAETHLKDSQTLLVPGYSWFNHQRKEIHRKAWSGSGGVGFLVKTSLFDMFDVTVLDKDVDGILWLKFSARHATYTFCTCVCYLPPQRSSRSVPVDDFYGDLISQVHRFQNLGSFFICGDLNGRLGDREDFIAGVDEVSERDVIDFTANGYGDALLEFLWSTNCCILNGRNNSKNDFTCINAIGHSVVDYCIVPHESLNLCSGFQVLRARELVDLSNCISSDGVIPAHVVPDHSLLSWNFNMTHPLFQLNNYPDTHKVTFTKYETSQVPVNFLMNPECTDLVNRWINHIKDGVQTQESMDNLYSDFVKSVSVEMERLVPFRVITMQDGVSNKKRRRGKPWWSDQLSNLWNILCENEKAWSLAKGTAKARLKMIRNASQKDFDREVQKCKRRYWCREQEHLRDIHSNNPKQFWNFVGNLGVGQERKKGIPMEVLLRDGSISRKKEDILSKWKEDFSNLLNPEDISGAPPPDVSHIPSTVPDPLMNAPITRSE